MATPEEVAKLASLARISLDPETLPTFAKEFDAILAYVGQLDSLTVGKQKSFLPYANVMREDGTPHEKGMYTDKLVEQFPSSEDTYLVVKQIISHD